MNEGLLTISQAAERLNVHPNTLRNWSDQGRVRVIVLPTGHRRYRAEDIDRLLQESGPETASA